MERFVTPTSVVSLSYQDDGKNHQETVLLGHAHGLSAGLEAKLIGKTEGERFLVDLRGPDVNLSLFQTVPRETLAPDAREGDRLYAVEDGQPRSYRIVRLGETDAELDANPQDAGGMRQLSVELLSVQTATSEELAHGHVHGEGGHQH